MSLNQKVGYAFGAVYVVVGLLGFVLTGFEGFAEPEGELLLGIFEVNPLHNLVHVLVGGVLAGGAAAGAPAARSANLAVGGVYLVLGVIGFFIPVDSSVNILALNVADHFLHLATAVVLLGAAMYAGSAARTRA